MTASADRKGGGREEWKERETERVSARHMCLWSCMTMCMCIQSKCPLRVPLWKYGSTNCMFVGPSSLIDGWSSPGACTHYSTVVRSRSTLNMTSIPVGGKSRSASLNGTGMLLRASNQQITTPTLRVQVPNNRVYSQSRIITVASIETIDTP